MARFRHALTRDAVLGDLLTPPARPVRSGTRRSPLRQSHRETAWCLFVTAQRSSN